MSLLQCKFITVVNMCIHTIRIPWYVSLLSFFFANSFFLSAFLLFLSGRVLFISIFYAYHYQLPQSHQGTVRIHLLSTVQIRNNEIFKSMELCLNFKIIYFPVWLMKFYQLSLKHKETIKHVSKFGRLCNCIFVRQ